MNKNRSWVLIAPLAASWVAACSSSPAVDIGDPVGGALTDYAASWDGYAEAYQFEDKSDRVRLVLDGNGAGTLRVGNAALLAPASDPNVAYPPGTTSDSYNDLTALEWTLLPGFEYPVHGPRIQDSRIRIGAAPNDLYGRWCALQTAFPSNGLYSCVGDEWFLTTITIDGNTCSRTDPATQETHTIDCTKLYLCLRAQVCRCTASACAADVPATLAADDAPVSLDAALSADGSELTGTLVVNDKDRLTVRLHR